jgi:hypothetical protein
MCWALDIQSPDAEARRSCRHQFVVGGVKPNRDVLLPGQMCWTLALHPLDADARRTFANIRLRGLVVINWVIVGRQTHELGS